MCERFPDWPSEPVRWFSSARQSAGSATGLPLRLGLTPASSTIREKTLLSISSRVRSDFILVSSTFPPGKTYATSNEHRRERRKETFRTLMHTRYAMSNAYEKLFSCSTLYGFNASL